MTQLRKSRFADKGKNRQGSGVKILRQYHFANRWFVQGPQRQSVGETQSLPALRHKPSTLLAMPNGAAKILIP
ncbi:MAG: hypothetical protein IPG51_18285 [Chloroflexi bacterium]|nr:hypothetical protein [Chloroflexota bacterium]